MTRVRSRAAAAADRSESAIGGSCSALVRALSVSCLLGMFKVHLPSRPITRKEGGKKNTFAVPRVTIPGPFRASESRAVSEKPLTTQRGRPPAEAAPPLCFFLCWGGWRGANRCFDSSFLTQSARTRHPSHSHVALKGLSA